MANPHLKMTVKVDPFISRMAHHSTAMPDFRKKMADLMRDGRAFVFQQPSKTCVCVHPSDSLLDAFYSAMGLE